MCFWSSIWLFTVWLSLGFKGTVHSFGSQFAPSSHINNNWNNWSSRSSSCTGTIKAFPLSSLKHNICLVLISSSFFFFKAGCSAGFLPTDDINSSAGFSQTQITERSGRLSLIQRDTLCYLKGVMYFSVHIRHEARLMLRTRAATRHRF